MFKIFTIVDFKCHNNIKYVNIYSQTIHNSTLTMNKYTSLEIFYTKNKFKRKIECIIFYNNNQTPPTIEITKSLIE